MADFMPNFDLNKPSCSIGMLVKWIGKYGFTDSQRYNFVPFGIIIRATEHLIYIFIDGSIRIMTKKYFEITYIGIV